MIHLYSIFHHKIFDEMYTDTTPEDIKKLTMFGVNESYPKEYNKNKNYPIVFEYDLPFYNPKLQQLGYCQTTAMYHIYHNELKPVNLVNDTSYVGFIQYDMQLYNNTFSFMEDRVKASVSSASAAPVVPIFYSMAQNYYQIQEVTQLLSGAHSALDSYNKFFNSSKTINDIKDKKFILLHTFVMPTSMFCRMMDWLTGYLKVLDTHFTSNFDRASFVERCHSLFLALEPNVEFMEFPIYHNWPTLHNSVLWNNYQNYFVYKIKLSDNYSVIIYNNILTKRIKGMISAVTAADGAEESKVVNADGVVNLCKIENDKQTSVHVDTIGAVNLLHYNLNGWGIMKNSETTFKTIDYLFFLEKTSNAAGEVVENEKKLTINYILGLGYKLIASTDKHQQFQNNLITSSV